MSSATNFLPVTLGVAAIALTAGYYIGTSQTETDTQENAATAEQKPADPDTATLNNSLMPGTAALHPEIAHPQTSYSAAQQPALPATNGLPPQSGQAHLHNKAEPDAKFTHFRVGQRKRQTDHG